MQTNQSRSSFEPVYRLSGHGRRDREEERLALLEDIFDSVSRQRRAFVQPGWRCLGVGAGRGSMAVWLAQQVGTTGRVVATDVDTSYLKRLDLIAGLMHVTHHGPYAMVLAFLTGALVYKVGIFEGLLVAMAVHGVVHYLVDSQTNKRPAKAIVGDYFASLRKISSEY